MPSESAPRTASPIRVVKAVLWSFLGVRRRAGHETDVAQLKPAQVVVAGLIAAAIFVLGLILLVRVIISRVA